MLAVKRLAGVALRGESKEFIACDEVRGTTLALKSQKYLLFKNCERKTQTNSDC